ncbi:hypothetical protein [Saccharothrix variisporea]|uniref:Dehydratase n=1 Tax=Saccharothrix variisporea TaxID=543527 RepID=A0A495XNC5_9PSEU|nr:hypothetical protein [Saccharothrix variisporea]RKT74705.1 hypothetical protein DFJ66_8072 [Saccharothrix variisporea]
MNPTKTRATAVVTALVATTLFAPSASADADGGPHATTATTVTVPYLCRTTENGGWIPLNGHKRNYDTVAPVEVKAGQVFLVSVDPAPSTTNAEYMKTIKDVVVAYKLPSNAVLLGYALSGASGLGPAAPQVQITGDQFVVTAPGPIAGGTVYDMPKVTFVFSASRAGTVTTAPGGTGFEQPGFAFTRLLVGETEWGPVQCYPDPAQPVGFTATTVR